MLLCFLRLLTRRRQRANMHKAPATPSTAPTIEAVDSALDSEFVVPGESP